MLLWETSVFSSGASDLLDVWTSVRPSVWLSCTEPNGRNRTNLRCRRRRWWSPSLSSRTTLIFNNLIFFLILLPYCVTPLCSIQILQCMSCCHCTILFLWYRSRCVALLPLAFSKNLAFQLRVYHNRQCPLCNTVWNSISCAIFNHVSSINLIFQR